MIWIEVLLAISLPPSLTHTHTCKKTQREASATQCALDLWSVVCTHEYDVCVHIHFICIGLLELQILCYIGINWNNTGLKDIDINWNVLLEIQKLNRITTQGENEL